MPYRSTGPIQGKTAEQNPGWLPWVPQGIDNPEGQVLTVNTDAYLARMRECARAMGRDFAPMKERHVSARLVERDAELAERGFASGLLAVEHANRVRTADPFQGTAWLVEGNPSHLCWEYLPHLAAYVELVEDLSYPAAAVRFETSDAELNLDLAVVDHIGRVLVLGEVKSEPGQILSLETLVPTFAHDPGKPATVRAGGPNGARRGAWKLTHQLRVTRAPYLWLAASGARAAFDVEYGDTIVLNRRDSLPSAGQLWPSGFVGPTPRISTGQRP
jgi:hypothetical protein